MAGGDKLTFKQEKFCRNIVKGMNKSDAYRDAYDAEDMKDKTINENASRLSKDSKITARIEKLQEDQRILLEYDISAHIKELDEVKESAMCPRGEYGNVNEASAVRAVELKGKVLGMYVEKKESKVEVAGTINVSVVTGKKKKKEAKK